MRKPDEAWMRLTNEEQASAWVHHRDDLVEFLGEETARLDVAGLEDGRQIALAERILAGKAPVARDRLPPQWVRLGAAPADGDNLVYLPPISAGDARPDRNAG